MSDATVELGGVLALAGALAVSLVVLAALSEEKRLTVLLRERFAFGVPWGTLIIVVGVTLVYYLLQGGGKEGGPIITGFRSWSLWYPQGLVLSSFSHSSDGHLISNMLGTIAFGLVAEYAWGQYSTTSATWWTTPVRRIGLFVLAAILVGLASSLFVPGAVIGFSVVVFAFAGFALVMRPRLSVFAILGVQILSLLRKAFLNPLITVRSRTVFFRPSWADIALQGHLFGMLVGVVLAVGLLRARDSYPELRYVWFAALVFAVTRSMYAVYWFEGANRFVLFRALGTAGAFLLAVLVGLAALSPELSVRDGARTVLAAVSPVRSATAEEHNATGERLAPLASTSISTAATALLIAVLCALAVSGLAYNLVSVSPGENVEDGIEVGDYRVAYVEGASDQYVSAVELPGVGSPLSADVSGVVVASDQRNAWELALSSSKLTFEGNSTVVVGDATFRETVQINRTAWRFSGGNSTYRIVGQHDGDREVLFTSEPASGRTTINGSTVRIAPAETSYTVAVERNGSTVDTARVPPQGKTIQLANITFERTGDRLLARHDETELVVASYRVRRRGR